MTQAFKPTIEILVYFNYEDYKNLLSNKLGIDRKDFRDFSYDGEKHDLWHWFMDEVCYGDVQNGSYKSVYAFEIENDIELEEWEKKVVLAHNEVVKELEELGKHDVTLYIYW